MDKHHFGGSRAHEVLAEYLTEIDSPRLCQRASAMLQQYSLDIKEIIKSNMSKRMKLKALRMLELDYINNSINGTNFSGHEFLRTLLINVVTIGYRKSIGELS